MEFNWRVGHLFGGLRNRLVLNTHALRIWVVQLLVYSALSLQVEHCLGFASEHWTKYIYIYIYILSQASFRRHSLHNSINTVPQVKSKTMFFVSHLNFDPVKRPSSGWMAIISITHHYYMITNKFEDLLTLHSLGASVIPWGFCEKSKPPI